MKDLNLDRVELTDDLQPILLRDLQVRTLTQTNGPMPPMASSRAIRC